MLDPAQTCAVFLDIDRTLISNSFQVPQENLEAIAAARAAGHRVFINSGRSWANIPDELKVQLEVDGYIAGNGAYLRLGERELFRVGFPTAAIEVIAAFVFQHREFWIVFEGYRRNYAISNEIRKADASQLPVESVADFMRAAADDEIQCIAIGPSLSPALASLLSANADVMPMGYYADCAIPGCSKAEGMRQMLEEIGVSRENSIAIGDSANDLRMLSFAGVGVAVANAEENVLNHADLVTASNQDCGVAKAIKSLLGV